jgi:hypothetical protein
MSSWSWAVDRIEYAVMSVRLAILDWICGPEPTTSADRQREADKDRLQDAFPAIDLDRKGRKR